MGTGLLVVLSGPSGAGKGTLCKALLEQMPSLNYSVSLTTRLPRAGEIDGVNYFFVTQQKFEEMIANNELLEWARVHDNYYGTPRSYIEQCLTQGEDVILEIDTQGAMQIKAKFPEAVFIFILPPSLAELAARISKRGTETPEVIAKRLKAAVTELSYITEYDYIVTNDIIDDALNKLMAIITAEKSRVKRQPKELIESLKKGEIPL